MNGRMERVKSAAKTSCRHTLSVLVVTGLCASGAAQATAATPIPQSTCFWQGPAASAFDTDPERNYAFPDSGAIYWSAKVTMPAGSKIILRGRYARARYQSLNSYDATTNAPTDALNDVSTKPDPGSTNPFRVGARRDGAKRSYTVTMLNEPAPATRVANTLYAGVAGQTEQQLVYRVYVPDSFTKKELTGGVGLPAAELQLADGTVLTGRAACDALQVKLGPLGLTKLPASLYATLREPAGAPPTFPATERPTFRAYYSTAFSFTCGYQGDCSGSPARIGGQYSNIDNQYISAFVNRGFAAGPVLVLTGRLPKTQQTGAKVKTMPAGQMRYWSMCQNESIVTTRGAGCVYDAQIPVDRKGNYTIVTSTAADRPKNATARCGVAYIPWPKNGDGAGHPKDGFLLVRNMLPSASFKHAVQNTRTPGDEAKVMGPYLPRGTYTTRRKFEQRGC